MYEDLLGLNVQHGKMSEARKQELLAKISKVASNDLQVFDGTDKDIRLVMSDDN